ncbi:RDD family protein [Streptosporangium sp. V21-05]|uniref:RDD family protein n=1 Tax=Streptosporangium sp. V21-05 TaxID=3446115 RepID=UPI003F53CA8A
MSDVVTGEAVVVEVRVAQLPSRAAALLIDMTVQVVTLLGASLLVGSLGLLNDPALTAMVYIVLTVLVVVGYPVIFETLTRGRSLGKLALGLRVVSDDGGPERFRQALFRGLAGVLEFWMLSGAPALISSLISEKGKRLGDLFSGTIVISERVPRQYGPPLDMPPTLAPWAATLELSRLPEQVAATARQYLTRWHDLAPAVQHEMGVRIATEMSAFVSPPAPPGVPPFAYLTAVLAERRRREQARLARQWHDRQQAGGQRPGERQAGQGWSSGQQTGQGWPGGQRGGQARPGEQLAGGQRAGQGWPGHVATPPHQAHPPSQPYPAAPPPSYAPPGTGPYAPHPQPPSYAPHGAGEPHAPQPPSYAHPPAGEGPYAPSSPSYVPPGAGEGPYAPREPEPRPHARPAYPAPQPRIPLPPPAEPAPSAHSVLPSLPSPPPPPPPPPPAAGPVTREPGPTPGGFVPPA